MSERPTSKIPWVTYAVIVGTGLGAATIVSLTMLVLLQPDRSSIVDSNSTANPSPRVDRNRDDSQLETLLNRSTLTAQDVLAITQRFPGPPPEAEEDQTAVAADLPLELVGTIASDTPFGGVASIRRTDKPGQAASFQVGEAVMPDVILVGVMQAEVLLKVRGQLQYLRRPEPPEPNANKRARSPVITVKKAPTKPRTNPAGKLNEYSYSEEGIEIKDGTILISRAKLNYLTGPQLQETLQGALAQPNMVDGQIQGFSLVKVKPDSIFAKVGLTDGDVITGIDGQAINNAAQALGLLNSLKSAASTTLQVRRGGVEYDLNVQVR